MGTIERLVQNFRISQLGIASAVKIADKAVGE